MTTSSSVELGHELRDVAACLRRVPGACLRDLSALVEWHSDLARRVDQAAKLIAPKAARPPFATPSPETRFATGTIAGPSGRLIRVERRRRAA